MKVRAPSRYVLLGMSLALMLQTNYRFAGPVGIGELLMMAYLAMVLVSRISTSRNLVILKPDRLTMSILGVVVFIIMPMTFFSSAFNTPGASFRDLAAYLLVCAVLVAIPRTERDIRTTVSTFLMVLFITLFLQYIYGGASAYYSFRFTGGAKNPNQLALYLAAAVLLSACLKSMTARIVVSLLALFFGVKALSDAYLIFVFVSALIFVFLTIIPSRFVLYILPLLLFVFCIIFFFSGLSDLLLYQWEVADEGGSRIRLYVSAIYAWLDTPVSVLFGHGAGSFSGMSGPFEMAEAHNTVLDLANVAGIFGLLLFPIFPIRIAAGAILKNHHFIPAALMGFVAFAFFHFVGRQPVFWVSLVLIVRFIEQRHNKSDLVVSS